jgi:serine/threonine-protein kinase HipA
VIVANGKVELSPAYDLLNSTIVLKGDAEEIALPLKGKKKNLTREILIDYFGKERCGLTEIIISKTLDIFREQIPHWFTTLETSFMSAEMKNKYRNLLETRRKVLSS